MTITPVSAQHTRPVAELVDAFLAGYWSPRTRANYAFIVGGWIDWCTAHSRRAVRRRPAGDRGVER